MGQAASYIIYMSVFLQMFVQNSLPTSQPSEDARLARRQRIVPREEWRMRKNSRSSSEKCNCKV